MKICWNNLEKIRLTQAGNLKKGSNIYIEKNKCKECGNPYLTKKQKPSKFCSTFCERRNVGGHMLDKKQKISSRKKISNGITGPKNPLWKGGVIKANLPLYNTYLNQLSFVEEVRPYIDDEGRKLLEVRCSKCNKWFVPKLQSVVDRVRSLNGKKTGEQRLYCSQECKNNCEVYRKRPEFYLDLTEKGFFYTETEISVWSKEVISRADRSCEICGKPAKHAHHIQPKKVEPGLSLDPENGLALCSRCHYKYGHQDECSMYNLAKKQIC